MNTIHLPAKKQQKGMEAIDLTSHWQYYDKGIFVLSLEHTELEAVGVVAGGHTSFYKFYACGASWWFDCGFADKSRIIVVQQQGSRKAVIVLSNTS